MSTPPNPILMKSFPFPVIRHFLTHLLVARLLGTLTIAAEENDPFPRNPTVPAFVYRPKPDPTSAGPTPRHAALVLWHGGPEGQSKLGWQGRQNYLLQELGVAVLEPNVRGSSGYGKTFLSLDDGRLREDSVKDMGAAIDWIATQPRLDAARVLVSGGSYGGYMALAASTKLADRLAGAMSAVGISNFVTFLERTESYRRDLRRVE